MDRDFYLNIEYNEERNLRLDLLPGLHEDWLDPGKMTQPSPEPPCMTPEGAINIAPGGAPAREGDASPSNASPGGAL